MKLPSSDLVPLVTWNDRNELYRKILRVDSFFVDRNKKWNPLTIVFYLRSKLRHEEIKGNETEKSENKKKMTKENIKYKQPIDFYWNDSLKGLKFIMIKRMRCFNLVFTFVSFEERLIISVT